MMDDIRETTTEADPGEPTALEKAARELLTMHYHPCRAVEPSHFHALRTALEAGPVGEVESPDFVHPSTA